jgi:hypothetical protein
VRPARLLRVRFAGGAYRRPAKRRGRGDQGRIDLDVAIDNRWIGFWYQPKIDLRRKQLVGIEAFARPRHPANGVLMPSAFIVQSYRPKFEKWAAAAPAMQT